MDAVAAETPELVGPDLRLRELFSLVVSANLENFAAAIAFKIPAESAFEPPAAIEHARLLGQRGVTASSMLLGYQVVLRSLIGPVIEAVEEFVDDPRELARTIEAVLAHLLVQANGAAQAALRTHALARDAWMRGREVGLSKRLDAVLDRVISDADTAERALNYVVSGKHVAFIAWFEGTDRPIDIDLAERRIAELQGVRDSLLVRRDEQTLYAWLHVADSSQMDQWLDIARSIDGVRVALGEIAEGLEGFRLSHLQAKSTSAVILSAGRQESTMVARYRDVAPLSFLVERAAETRAWVELVLGELAGPGEDLARLRETLGTFLDEGENAIATGEKLFVHRNTVKYRVDKAVSLMPHSLSDRRLDVALALRYANWVGVLD